MVVIYDPKCCRRQRYQPSPVNVQNGRGSGLGVGTSKPSDAPRIDVAPVDGASVSWGLKQ